MKPLPEMGVNINGDFGAKNWRADPPRGMHQRLSLEEKKEAARRCNAYPELVKALRGIALRHADGSLCFDGCDKAGLVEPSPFCVRYVALLRELGEVE